ncbi:MAG: hypothetical protein GW802_37800, partial [Armatimonadetes bacterium]|nr:hypothetical protein [Armatimonadota bacterium]
TDGEAIGIQWARLEIGGQVLHQEIAPGAGSVTFELDLPAGPAHFTPCFYTVAAKAFAPYYIYVRREGA